MSERDRAILRTLNTPLLPCFLALFLVTMLLWKALHHADFDPRTFIVAGSPLSDARVLGADFPIIVKSNGGYDGQFYYRLAHNPFTSTQTAYGITLDVPAYRHQRILYPFLAWCLSLGQHAFLPWILILINVTALGAIGWLGGWWAKTLGKHAFWGVLLVLHIGFIMSFMGDLAEILEIACALWGLMFAHQKKWFAASLLLSLAVLTKETAMPLALTAAFFCCLQPRLKRKPIEPSTLWLLLPLITYASTQLILKATWGVFPVAAGGHNLSLPFKTLSSMLFPSLQTPHSAVTYETVELWLYMAFIALVFFQWRRSPLASYIKVAWTLCASLFVSLGIYVLRSDLHFTRAFSEVYILGMLFLLTASLRTRFALLSITFTICLLRASPFVS